jgi:hypothetical protein
LDFGFWLLAFGFWLLAFGFWLLAFENAFSAKKTADERIFAVLVYWSFITEAHP